MLAGFHCISLAILITIFFSEIGPGDVWPSIVGASLGLILLVASSSCRARLTRLPTLVRWSATAAADAVLLGLIAVYWFVL